MEIDHLSTERRNGKIRIIAWVSVNSKSLNKALVKEGLAWWFRKYAPYDKEIEELEKEACKLKKGLWSHPNPCPPWVYRKGKAKCAEYQHSCDSVEL